MPSETVQRYLNRIESQHRQRPRFMAHVEALLNTAAAGYDAAEAMPARFDLASATGDQLDILGQRVGASRGIRELGGRGGTRLDDETFRLVIYAKIFQNQWDGTKDSFQRLWNDTVGRLLNAEYFDNQDMTVGIVVSGDVPPLALQLLAAGYLIPRPMGVRYNVTVPETAEADSIFGGTALVLECVLYNVSHRTVTAT